MRDVMAIGGLEDTLNTRLAEIKNPTPADVRRVFNDVRIEAEAHLAELTANQAKVRAGGQAFRIFSPVRARDHEGNVYSLNKGFLDEFITYPFSAKKDLIDAVSRLYDMEPVPPVLIDESTLEPETFVD